MQTPNDQTSSDADLVRSYLKEISRIPLLTHEQEITLGRQVQELICIQETEQKLELKNGIKPTQEELANSLDLSINQVKRKIIHGKRAKEQMVSSNLRLVVSIAKKYTKRSMELLDLVQEGTIGLIRGVEKFDPTRGYKFSTYAYWWIRQGITRAISEQSRTIRLPIHITEELNKLKKAQRDLSQSLGRTPTVIELAKMIKLTEKEVKELLCHAKQPVSLEMKIGDGDDTVLLELLPSEIELPEEYVNRKCLRRDLLALVEQLPEIQVRILKMRYGFDSTEPLTLTGIGRVLGMSRDRVRNLERDGINRLQKLSKSIEGYLD
uniref:Type II alternative RNA polymerase sigma factor, sigma-70 family protein n=1 Tax=Paulinella chromatophora TaxID=39717 RepID=B1X4M1_PAUCH|nr:type II alternative RNA polymerase sigma factor, sigma-70 family protein [Paulinella chromatophora]ACB42890.1 type II alternative RNA polymerase sigma factor, sigma-70 family protein [Paulinella chromatophora]